MTRDQLHTIGRKLQAGSTWQTELFSQHRQFDGDLQRTNADCTANGRVVRPVQLVKLPES